MKNVLELDTFKSVSQHFEEFYRLPPLTARVYTLFIFNNCTEGLTFETVLDVFNASKSSISHSINLLIELGFLVNYKKENERKRYFKVNRNLFLIRLREVQKMLQKECETTLMLREYRKNAPNAILQNEAFDAYMGHLNLTIDSLETTIQKLKTTL